MGRGALAFRDLLRNHQEVESTLLGEKAPGLWVMHFDGAFNLPGAGAGAVLTSPSGDKLYDAI
jgi:hypothetical protein